MTVFVLQFFSLICDGLGDVIRVKLVHNLMEGNLFEGTFLLKYIFTFMYEKFAYRLKKVWYVLYLLKQLVRKKRRTLL